jgi:hypothetical protein
MRIDKAQAVILSSLALKFVMAADAAELNYVAADLGHDAALLCLAKR